MNNIIIQNNLKNNTRGGSHLGGSKTEDKALVACGACHKTGYSDYPVCLIICPICRGTRFVRV